MIRNDIKTLVDRLGITPYKFWKETGLAKDTAYGLYKKPEYIPKKDVMERLAVTYGWQPGQYIYYDFGKTANCQE